MFREFRQFIARGNVIDLAVAVIIGAAFSGIINAVVQDLITPLLGLLGDRNFSDLYLVIKGNVPPNTPYEAAKSMAVVFGYGSFITAVINFVLIALVVFALIRAVAKLQQPKGPAVTAPEPDTKSERLLTEIRDLLKTK